MADGAPNEEMTERLNTNELNYISLEIALSDLRIISQIPLNYISTMSSRPNSTISCGSFGTIDFVHTTQKADVLTLFSQRVQLLNAHADIPADCYQKLSRFLPTESLTRVVDSPLWWRSIAPLLNCFAKEIQHAMLNAKVQES